jgi:hypothetical protein
MGQHREVREQHHVHHPVQWRRRRLRLHHLRWFNVFGLEVIRQLRQGKAFPILLYRICITEP